MKSETSVESRETRAGNSTLDARPGNAEVEALEAAFLPHPENIASQLPLLHHFAPHVYMREIFMPAGPNGMFVIGHEHRTEHYNIVLTGSAMVAMNGVVQRIVAPAVFSSGAGVRKVLFIEEDMRWITVHPTDETDLEKLEEELIVKSETCKAYEQLKQLQNHMNTETLNSFTV